MKTFRDKVNESAEFIKSKITAQPEVGMVLGSGLGVLAEEVEEKITIPYKEIPNFPVSTVAGHSGCLVFGKMEGKYVLIQNGRWHFYEGYPMSDVTFFIRVLFELGVKKLFVTNAAGGINPLFVPGDLMLISDHVNMMGTNPLIGPNDEHFGTRFPDLSKAYTPEYRTIALECAAKLGKRIHEGVYMGLTGPSYETQAELRMFQKWGVDAVGMSTVPEVIVAAHCGMKVIGISCITNIFSPGKAADHKEVLEAAEKVKPFFKSLTKLIVSKI